jgi:superfamily II DNA or RNA helicase
MQKLRDCQKQAIYNFNKYFYIDNDGENDRGIISMCCGSGKTRTMYEIIKLCHSCYNKNFLL